MLWFSHKSRSRSGLLWSAWFVALLWPSLKWRWRRRWKNNKKTHTCSLCIRWQGHRCALSVQRTFLTFPCPEGRALCGAVGPEIEALSASSSCGAFCEWLDTSRCSHQVGRACTAVSRSLFRSPAGGRLERSKRSCETVKRKKIN